MTKDTYQVEGDACGVANEVAVRKILGASAAGLTAHLPHDVVQYGVGVLGGGGGLNAVVLKQKNRIVS